MKTSTKIALTAALIGTLGIGAVVRTVYASPSHKIVQVAEADDGDGETNDDAHESQEAAKLQPLAKITAQQAQKAAETSVNGKARGVKLENEDGNLVYAVEIGQQFVKVDAGNNKVLYTENASQEDEKNEASRPKSSIQVPDRQDGSRETKHHAK